MGVFPPTPERPAREPSKINRRSIDNTLIWGALAGACPLGNKEQMSTHAEWVGAPTQGEVHAPPARGAPKLHAEGLRQFRAVPVPHR